MPLYAFLDADGMEIQMQQGEINRHWGGRGVYFQDLSGRLLEIITRPYRDVSKM